MDLSLRLKTLLSAFLLALSLLGWHGAEY